MFVSISFGKSRNLLLEEMVVSRSSYITCYPMPSGFRYSVKVDVQRLVSVESRRVSQKANELLTSVSQ